MIIQDLFESPQLCPECGGVSFSDLILAEKKDACYYKVKASAKVWPSAYASGRLVQCRKKGAANYGNKSEGVAEGSESQYMAARYIDEFGDGDHWYVKGTPDVIQKFVQLANSLEDEAVKGTEYEPGKGQMAKLHAKLGDDSVPQWTSVPAQNLESIRPIGNKVLQRLTSPDLSAGVQEFMSELLWAMEAKGLALVHSDNDQGVAEAIDIDVFNPGFRHELQLGQYLYRASSKIKNQKYGLMITVYDGNKLIADAEFHVEPQPFDKRELRQDAKYSHLESYYTNVEPAYQRQGIMTNMYYYANALGNTIKPSDVRTNDSIAAWRSWGKDAKYLKKEGVAEGSLNEFAPSDGEGNGPFDYGRAIIEIGQEFTEYYNDEGAESDARAIIKVGQTFISAGMKAGIQAFYNNLDTVVRDHVAEQLQESGFNVKQDIYLPYKQQMAATTANYKTDLDKYKSSPKYAAWKADELTISAIPDKPINSWSKPGEPAASVTMDRASKRNIKAEFEKFKQDLALRDSLKGVPLRFEITVGGKPMDINSLREHSVAESSEAQKTFEIVYYSPKTDRNVTTTVKADSESAVWDRFKQKGIDVVSVKQKGVAEGSDKTFTVVYYSKKTDRTVTKQIKASSESELWDRLRAKDIDVISVEEQGVAEGSLNENQNSGIVYATGPRTTGTNDVDLIFKNLTTNKIVAWVVGNNDDGGVYEIRINQNGVKKGPPNFVATGNPQDDSDQHLIYKLGKPGTGRMSAIGSVMQNGFDKKNSTYYGQPLEFVGDDDWWSFLENMIGDITWEDDAIDAGYVDRLDNGDLVFVKQNLSRDSLNELAPNPGGGDGGGGDDGDDGFELPLDFKGQNVLVWPKNKKYSMGDTATPFPRGERFTGKVYIMWDGPKIEAIFYLDPKDREDREAEYERVYGPQGRGYEDWLDHKWYDTTTPRYRFVTDWKLKPAKEPGGWPGIVDAWGQDMKAEVMNHAQNFINDIIHNDGDGRHFVEPKQSVAEGYLNEFAPGDGNGEGRWYTDDQMIDMVGSDWAPEDDAGHLSLGQRLQDAQAWLDDQGYSVAVEDVQIDPDGGYRWKIYGEFYNPRFAKKDQGVAETSDYFRRREREEAIISGQKPARKKQPAQTSDYARRRAQEKKAEKGVAEMDDRRHVRYHQVDGDPGENPRASEYRGPWYLDVEGTILQDKNSQPQQFWSYNDAYQYAVNLTNYLRQHGQPLKYAIAITREPKSNSAKI